MLIIDYKGGQLANRLFLFAYFIANSIEYKFKLINPFFEDYAALFPAVANNDYPEGLISTRFAESKMQSDFIQHAIRGARYFSKKKNGHFFSCVFHSIRQTHDAVYKVFDMNDAAFVNMAQQKIIFAKGWHYRDASNLVKHAGAIKKIFRPAEKYMQQVNAITNSARNANTLLIGVHLRKGDYANFFEGRWFYENSVYVEKMKTLKFLLQAQGKEAKFIVCSNEKINEADFDGLEIISGEREAITDLYTLAACDYIIGPPSTFSMWASYYGNVPLLILKNKTQTICLHDARVMNGIESFF